MFRNIARLVVKTSRCQPSRLFAISSAHSAGTPGKDSTESNDYEVIPLTPKHYEGSWKALTEVFFKEEKACEFLGLDKNTAVQNELKDLFFWIADDGVSVITRDTRTDEVVGASYNKIWVPNDYKYVESYGRKCSHPLSRKYIKEIVDLDIFGLCKVDCIYELFAAGSYKNIRGKRLSTQMLFTAIDTSKKLSKVPDNKKAPKAFLVVSSTPSAKYVVDKSEVNKRIELNRVLEYDGRKISIDYQYDYLLL